MSALAYVTLCKAWPARDGLRTAEVRTCVDCADEDHARERGPSDDQASPCACCGRTAAERSVPPTCHHDAIWALVRAHGF